MTTNGIETTVISKFVGSFFDELSAHNIKYCVLRGYQTLPDLPGRDIDICLENSIGIIERVFAIIIDLGWKYHIKHNDDGFLSIVCMSVGVRNIDVVLLDFWTSFNWRGISWCSHKDVLNDRNMHNNIYVASSGAEAAITSLKEIIGGGCVKKKSYERITELVNQGKDRYIDCLASIYGGIITEALAAHCSNGEFRRINMMKQLLKFVLIMKHPFRYLWMTSYRVFMATRQIIRPTGKLIAFVGPDGSGKTTVINSICEYVNYCYSGVRQYHIRYRILPELKTGYGFSSMKRIVGSEKIENNKNIVKVRRRPIVSIVASWSVVLYYTFEYMIGNLVLHHFKARNYVILYDRYYYDHYVQPATRDLIYPYRRFLNYLVSKPDVVIQLNTDPEIVYARKQELNKREIENQNKYFTKLLSEVENVYCIDTGSKSIDEIRSEVFLAVIKYMGMVN